MPTMRVNGVDMFYNAQGEGEPVVLVHGGFADHEAWALVVPELAGSFRVVTCDLRGHSATVAEPPLTMRDHVADVAALIEGLGLGPAHVAGFSLGAAIVLRMAADRPEVIASVTAHEPPTLSVLARRDDTRPMLYDLVAMFFRAMDAIEQDPAQGIPEFVDIVAPGVWPLVPPDVQAKMIANSRTFVDSDLFELDLARLDACGRPVVLTDGDTSPDFFLAITSALAEAVPSLEKRTIPGAGHVPHFTHPAEFANIIRSTASLAPVR